MAYGCVSYVVVADPRVMRVSLALIGGISPPHRMLQVVQTLDEHRSLVIIVKWWRMFSASLRTAADGAARCPEPLQSSNFDSYRLTLASGDTTGSIFCAHGMALSHNSLTLSRYYSVGRQSGQRAHAAGQYDSIGGASPFDSLISSYRPAQPGRSQPQVGCRGGLGVGAAGAGVPRRAVLLLRHRLVEHQDLQQGRE